jgi:hypothetical protein
MKGEEILVFKLAEYFFNHCYSDKQNKKEITILVLKSNIVIH